MARRGWDSKLFRPIVIKGRHPARLVTLRDAAERILRDAGLISASHLAAAVESLLRAADDGCMRDVAHATARTAAALRTVGQGAGPAGAAFIDLQDRLRREIARATGDHEPGPEGLPIAAE